MKVASQKVLREFDEKFKEHTDSTGEYSTYIGHYSYEQLKDFISHHLSLTYEAGVEEGVRMAREEAWNLKNPNSIFGLLPIPAQTVIIFKRPIQKRRGK